MNKNKMDGLRVCQEIVCWCPYCADTLLTKPDLPYDGYHKVTCVICGKSFGVPCQE